MVSSETEPSREMLAVCGIEAVPVRTSSGVSRPVEDLLIKRIQTWEEIESIRPAWDELLSDSEAQAIFLTWEWLSSWWAVYGRSLDLYFLGSFDHDGRLVGIAPLYRIRWPLRLRHQVWMLRLLGDGSGDSEGLDCIVRRGYEVAAVHAWLNWLDQRWSEWDILELNTLPAESPVAQILQEEFRQRGWRYWQQANPHLVLALPDSLESYLGSLSKKGRYSVLSSIRGIEKQFRVCLERCESQTELPRFLDRLFDLHAKRFKAKGEQGAFQWRPRRSFFCGNGQPISGPRVAGFLAPEFERTGGGCRIWILLQQRPLLPARRL